VLNTDRVDFALGVQQHARGGRFYPRIRRNGKVHYLGTFDTEEEAIAVRRKVKEKLDAEDATAVAGPSAASVIQVVMGMGISEGIVVGPFRDSRSSTRIVLTESLVFRRKGLGFEVRIRRGKQPVSESLTLRKKHRRPSQGERTA
jgi:hypothetical protein